MTTVDAVGASGAASPPALLQSTLDQLRLEGAIFFRTEFTEGFTVEAKPAAVAGVLHPGAERLILFHIVAQGSCWVAAEDGTRHWARQGDVLVLPYGDEHTIGGEGPAECVSILTLLDLPPWEVLPVVRHGGGGPRVDLVCGYLDDPSGAGRLRRQEHWHDPPASSGGNARRAECRPRQDHAGRGNAQEAGVHCKPSARAP